MPTTNDLDLGYVKEGVVELDPMTGRLVLRCESTEDYGTYYYFDVQEMLAKYKDEEVRLVIAPFATIKKLGEMVENGDLAIEEVPIAGSR